MQKTLLIIAMLYLIPACHANWGKGVKKIPFNGEITTTLPQNELFFKANKWVEFNLKNGENCTKDKELGQVVGTCSRKVNLEFSGISVAMIMHYTVTLEIHDKDITFQIEDIKYESIPDLGYSSRVTSVDHWVTQESGMTMSSIAFKYREKTIIEMNEVIEHLSAYLKRQN